jgi:hypothetical protein
MRAVVGHEWRGRDSCERVVASLPGKLTGDLFQKRNGSLSRVQSEFLVAIDDERCQARSLKGLSAKGWIGNNKKRTN